MTRDESTQKYKNQIITELFNSGIIQSKIGVGCWKHGIGRGSKIHEDVLNEVFLNLSKVKAKTIIECYEDKKNGGITPSCRLVRLTTVIMSRQGFANDTDSPKRSIMTHIMYASVFDKKNCNTNGFKSGGVEYEPDEDSFESTARTEENDFLFDLWELIQEQLSEDEKKFLEARFTEKKGRGKYKREISMQLDKIKEHIKQIVEESKIII